MRLNRTEAVFNATAFAYDQNRTRLIPGFSDLYGWVVALIPPGASSIVDLGAGSGLLTAFLREREVRAAVHLVDFSAPMLALARERLAAELDLSYHFADYLVDPVPAGVLPSAIVSALSIHHLDDADKRHLFGTIYAALPPGGVFINADHVAGPSAALEARYQSRWLAQVRSNGASEQQIADSLYRQQEDRRAAVEPQLAWMREAGFSDVDCWYKSNCFAVMAGSRT